MWLQKLIVHEPFLAQPWFMDMVITCMKLTWHDANVNMVHDGWGLLGAFYYKNIYDSFTECTVYVL